MKRSFKDIIKNVYYSFSANLLSLLISLMTFLVVPKIISVTDYGAWQLYNFYLGFVGLFHFGWIDGIYLRYAGRSYEELDKRMLAGQYYALAFLELIIGLSSFCLAVNFAATEYAKNSLMIVSIAGVFVILTTFTNFILQITNRIQEYAKLISYERLLFFSLTMGYIFLGFKNYLGLLFISLFVGFLSFLFSVYLIMEIVSFKVYNLSNILKEALTNINSGSKLMFANIASLLLLGIIRYGISQEWDIDTFGNVSLTLSISNFLMVFITSVSVVMFPIIKKLNQEQLPAIYVFLRNGLSLILFGFLIFYYPLKTILSMWLPQYAESLKYMAVLFPVCLFESKISLLVNTYLKSLRQEKLMLKINWMAVCFSLLLTFLSVYCLHNLDLAIFSIVIVFAFRCILAEYCIGKLLNLNLYRDIFLELCLVAIFISVSWFIDSWPCMALYFAGYIAYLLIKQNDLRDSIKMIKTVF